AEGRRNLRRARLIAPTDRYGHGVLGDAIEAGGVAAELAGGTTARLFLADDSVFEDLRPRLVDMDGDGRDQIVVVRSYLNAGAALAVIGERGGKLAVAAMAEPIGLQNRWLNPIGAADFDGDRRLEAAVVITPHIGGTLRLYEWRGTRLVPDGEAFGFSNHTIGSRELGQSAIADFNGDGVADIQSRLKARDAPP
ncbi:MAG: VCBS repeat-containing protein, partial [Rhodospirillaceae bacterium]